MAMDTDLTAARIAHLKTKPWNNRDFSVPEEIFAVPGMLSNQEKRMLYYLARDEYSGEGVIADMGSFLGGSTICFAAGLRARSFARPVIHAYDLFKLGEASSERKRYFPENPPPDLKTRAIFDQNLEDYLGLITVHEGDVLTFPWDDGPIEILFVDIAKSYKVMDHLLMSYFPALIPSKSLIVMQDYLWGTTGPWHHVVMEKLSDYCEYAVDTDIASVVFLVKQAIPREILSQSRWLEIPQDEKLLLMESAIEKLDTDEKKQFLIENRELLLQGKDMYWGMQYHNLSC
jgi:hypothetical protein